MGDNDVTLGKALDAAASAHKRIDALEREVKDLRTLTLAIAKVDSKVDNIKEDVEEIKQEVEALRASRNKLSKEIGALMAQKKKEEAEEVKKQFGIDVDKRKVNSEDIKAFGTYPAQAKFYQGITADFFVSVSEN